MVSLVSSCSFSSSVDLLAGGGDDGDDDLSVVSTLGVDLMLA